MKRKKQILLLIAFFQLGPNAIYAQFEIKLDEGLFISKISDTVYVVTHYFPWDSNSLIIKASDKDVVLIDTPCDTVATSLMLNWIMAILKPQKITAINTGYHIDNLGGNSSLRQNGIDIFGSDLTIKMIEERGNKPQLQTLSWLKSPEQDKYRKAYEGMKFTKPNKIFNAQEGANLNLGGLSFEIYYPGESHTIDNVVVYIKEIRLLFGGCMIKSLTSKNLGFTGDANMVEWPNSVKKVQEKYTSAKIVIPHHGMWGGTGLILHTLELFH